MWLLDVNLPLAVVDILKGFGIVTQTTESQGWRTLENGKLVEVAAAAGYKAILTRDNEFGLSAAKLLKKFPEIAVVIITLPQHKAKIYIAHFLEEWKREPIQPIGGSVVLWPNPKNL